MPALNIKYYDESSGQWGMRRPATHPVSGNTFSFLCIAVGGRVGPEDDSKKVSSLAALIQNHAPTFIILNEVTAPLYELIKDNPTIRAGYGVTEFSTNTCNMLTDGVVKPTDHASCFLVAHYVPLPFAEHKIKTDFNSEYPSRPFAVMFIRGFLGLQFAIGALHLDPLNIVATRATAIGKCLEKVDPNEVTLLFANFLESISSSIKADLPTVLAKMPNFNWCDVQRLQTEGPVAEPRRDPSALWMRRTETTPVTVQSSAVLNLDEFSYCSLTMFKAGQSQSSSASPTPSSGITIPQPRSSKPEVKSNTSPTPMVIDPAVVSVDKSPSTLPQAGHGQSPQQQQQQSPQQQQQHQQNNQQQQRSGFPGQPFRPPRRWFTDRVTHIRRPPDHDERDYDLGQFKTVDDAVRALNNGSFQWSFDYLIIGSNLLYCDGAKPSYPAFKRYCSEHLSQMNQWRRENNLPTGKAARLAAQRQPAAPLDVGSDDASNANTTSPPPQTVPKQDVLAASAPSIPSNLAFVGSTAPTSTNGGASAASGSATAAPKQQQHAPLVLAAPRQRVWSEHNATIIYQTTPLELRFDISACVGQAKNNLSIAVERLNTRKKVDVGGKADPLASYSNDYALLFNPERQAYWLLSCVDTPCDIVACRNYAYRLSNL